MIAERAELDVGIIRAIFVDKKRLLDTIMMEMTEPLVSSIGLAVDNVDDPRQLFREALFLLDQWAYDNPRAVRIFMWAMIDRPDFYDNIHGQAIMPSEFFGRLEKMAEKGQLKVNDPEIISLLIDSLIFVTHLFRPSFEHIYTEKETQLFFERRFEAVMLILKQCLFADKESRQSGDGPK